MTIINKEDFKIKKKLNRPILSLDYGEKRIGIGISDNECSIALPSEVLKRNKNDKDFLYIKEFIEKNNQIDINGKFFSIPEILINKERGNFSHNHVREALSFNKNLLLENFIIPNRLQFPNSRNILESYFQ